MFNKYKSCDIKYKNITLEECLKFYELNIACNSDADNEEFYFIQENRYDRSRTSIKTNR